MEIGLSVGDFDRLTPEEFGAVCEAWTAAAERRGRTDWERTRAVVVATLSPYLKKGTDPAKVFPLPWDGKPQPGAPRERLTDGQLAERYRSAAQSRGLG